MAIVSTRVVFMAAAALLLVLGSVEAQQTAPLSQSAGLYDCPSTSFDSLVVIPIGTTLTVTCQVRGESIGSDNIWLWTNYNGLKGYVADFYVLCNGGVGVCEVKNCY